MHTLSTANFSEIICNFVLIKFETKHIMQYVNMTKMLTNVLYFEFIGLVVFLLFILAVA